jgi:hypothetical protein
LNAEQFERLKTRDLVRVEPTGEALTSNFAAECFAVVCMSTVSDIF